MTDRAHPGAESSRIGRLAFFCCEHARAVALAGLLLGLTCLLFAASHFAMNTDTNALISKKLAWRVRETAYNHLFHPGGDQTVVVIDGDTPELAEQGAAAITAGLERRPDLFAQVTRPDGGPFFAQEGLLFSSLPEVRSRMADLISAQPFLGPLAADPSLRGLMGVLSTAAQGATSGQTTMADIAGPMARLAGSLEQTLAGRSAPFSWTNLISGGKPRATELRRFVITTPKLDYARFSAGAAADSYIQRLAARDGLDPAHGVRVRLTGAAPLADQQLASLAKGVDLIAGLALAAILLMLWLAVRSARLIAAILVTMFIGLAAATAIGLAIFGRFNVISVAFIPLFVGLGIDFGIQFTVRYRAARAETGDDHAALGAAGRVMGRSLTLAATAIAVGFLAFTPTSYDGVSQLGVIAGLGMFIALGLNLTVLPALIALLKPGSRGPIGPGRFLERLDGLILSRRRVVLGLSGATAIICAALIPLLRFDYNPLHLQDARAAPVATYQDLMRDPDVSR